MPAAGVRISIHAGQWYPGERDRLAKLVDGFLRDAGSDEPWFESIVGLVVPHAGLIYSGAIAAHAHRLLKNLDTDCIVILGPSHRVAFEGLALEPSAGFETPLGTLAFDEEAARQLAAESPSIVFSDKAHASEHCLEMQYPFVQRIRPDCRVLPLVMGRQSPQTVRESIEVLSRWAGERRPRPVLMASSDLSHYESRQKASLRDRAVLDRIDALDVDGLGRLIASEPGCACGAGPLHAVMEASRSLGATHGRVLSYGDSGDVTGELDAVVGYAAAGFGRMRSTVSSSTEGSADGLTS